MFCCVSYSTINVFISVFFSCFSLPVQIGSWVTTFVWLVHVILSCYFCMSYRRGDIEEPGVHLSFAAAEGTKPNAYRKLVNDGAL